MGLLKKGIKMAVGIATGVAALNSVSEHIKDKRAENSFYEQSDDGFFKLAIRDSSNTFNKSMTVYDEWGNKRYIIRYDSKKPFYILENSKGEYIAKLWKGKKKLLSSKEYYYLDINGSTCTLSEDSFTEEDLANSFGLTLRRKFASSKYSFYNSVGELLFVVNWLSFKDTVRCKSAKDEIVGILLYMAISLKINESRSE